MEYDLVFEGGGAKGLAFVGALASFEKRGHTVRRVIGTSAGSILAVMVAAGYNSADLLAAIAERLADGRSRPVPWRPGARRQSADPGQPALLAGDRAG
jgi:predicted acylesterase/phospholipase RssA